MEVTSRARRRIPSLEATRTIAPTAVECWLRSISCPSASRVLRLCKVTAAPAKASTSCCSIVLSAAWPPRSDLISRTRRSKTLAAFVRPSSAPVSGHQQVTQTVPIVFLNVSDPVGGGLIQSMSRPGGNSTGFTNYEDAPCSLWGTAPLIALADLFQPEY